MKRVSVLVALSATLWTGAAVAQTQTVPSSYSAQRFRLSLHDEGILDVEWAEVTQHLRVDASLWLDYEDDPLELRVGDNAVARVIDHRVAGGVLISVGLFEWVQVGLELPFVLHQGGERDVPGITGQLPALGQAGIGDIRLVPKVRILRQQDYGVGLALSLGVLLPTSLKEHYFGSQGVQLEPEILVSRRFEDLRLGANLGLRIRRKQAFLDLDVNEEIFGRFGAGYMLEKHLGVPLEVDASLAWAFSANDPFNQANTGYLELLPGVAWHFKKLPLIAFAGTGFGLSEGFGTPDFRVFAGLRFTGSLEPDPPKPATRPAPASQPASKPASQPVVKTATVTKTATIATKAPVTKTATVAPPPPDRDADTVPDAVDNCPDEPGSPDNQGCKAQQLVKVTAGKLEILDKVYFKTSSARIERRSYPLLDNVAQVLAKHPEIEHIRVEGHTDDRGRAKSNLRLSQRRADSVVAFLVKKGIAKDRLVAKGFGEANPVVDNGTKKGRATNRRVEFVIVGGSDSVDAGGDSKVLEVD